MDLRLHEWTYPDYMQLLEFLKDEADLKYRKFHSKLVPNTPEEEILGIRMPKLRELGKEIAKGNVRSYLAVSNSKLYEERVLRGIVIGLVKTNDFNEFTSLCDRYVEEIDSWAVCDTFCSGLKQIKKFKSEFFEYIQKYLNSGSEWKIRTALVIMLGNYLDDDYIGEVLKRCDSVENDAYYVSMAQAWLVATAFAKNREVTLNYLQGSSLSAQTINRAIQKCAESKRISDEDKELLKNFKR